MKYISAALLVASLSGCGATLPHEDELELRVLATTASGEEMRAAFINGSGVTVGIGHLECMTGVEQQVEGQWQSVDIWPGDQNCILPLYLIQPRRSYVYRTLAPTTPGTYRLVVSATVEGDRPDLPGGGRHEFVVRSAPFEVEE